MIKLVYEENSILISRNFLKMHFSQNAFFFRKLELKFNLGLDFTIDEFMEIFLSIYHVAILNFIEIQTHKCTDEIYELLLKYEYRHFTDCGLISCCARQRVACFTVF